jgi:OOP family OmpA-OmpF porin
MKLRGIRRLVLEGALVACLALAGCASAPIPYKQPVAVSPPSGRVAVSQAVSILDASGSHEELFADEKATLESIVAAMPDGSYDAGQVVFGGFQREVVETGPFDRARLAAAAKDARFLEGTTPLYHVFDNELADAVGGGSGRASIVVISDGLVTDGAGRSGADERTLAAARRVLDSRDGPTCFHTIQSGDAPAGASLLRSVAALTPCGSFRTSSSLGSASALQAFSREAYLGGAAPAGKPAPKPMAAAGADSDGDGVADASDACPNTLKSARVDDRGCWTLRTLRFAVNGAALDAASSKGMADDIAVLKANPGVRVRVDGHTDSDGSAAYNQSLSERRAASVRDYLVSQGLAADRFEIKGFGESKPIAPNDSAENKRRNRRVELTILD